MHEPEVGDIYELKDGRQGIIESIFEVDTYYGKAERCKFVMPDVTFHKLPLRIIESNKFVGKVNGT